MRKQRLLNKIKKHGYTRVKNNKPKQMYIRFTITPYKSPILLAAAKSMIERYEKYYEKYRDKENIN